MTVEAFLDTNIVVYAVSRSIEDTEKRSIAADLLNRSDIGTSAQVLQEFYTVATRKQKLRLSHDEALEWFDFFEDVPCVPTDLPLIVRAADIAMQFKISYWDGAIIAAAERLSARILYTEDLNHGQHYGTVQAINPFVAAVHQ
jgi:predicted nucleic acid-binding protein